jgi:Sec-independent protein secretion pathway component TatC
MTRPPPASPPPPELASAPLFDHLEELRRRLIFSVVFLAIGMVIAFTYRTQLIELVKVPLTYSELYTSGKVQLVTTRLASQLLLSFNLAFWAGLALALPLIVWQIWALSRRDCTRTSGAGACRLSWAPVSPSRAAWCSGTNWCCPRWCRS